nr:unnamed protein product [Spirometra erinaceieuropaei]
MLSLARYLLRFDRQGSTDGRAGGDGDRGLPQPLASDSSDIPTVTGAGVHNVLREAPMLLTELICSGTDLRRIYCTPSSLTH